MQLIIAQTEIDLSITRLIGHPCIKGRHALKEANDFKYHSAMYAWERLQPSQTVKWEMYRLQVIKLL